jgi:hypothetical protein
VQSDEIILSILSGFIKKKRPETKDFQSLGDFGILSLRAEGLYPSGRPLS